jgi:hypothetical protein
MIGFPKIANEMTKPTAHPYAPAAQNHRTEHDTFIGQNGFLSLVIWDANKIAQLV